MRRIATMTSLIVLMLLAGWTTTASAQAYDTLSIYDLQYVPDPVNDDLSPFLGDTVVVKGQVMTGPRDLWIGARWSGYIVDPDSFPNPWSGFFIVQNDTFAIGTQVGFLEPGMICYFTGVVSEFSNFSQITILDANPLVPVDIISVGNPMPDPVLLTAADLSSVASAEQWESMWVRLEDATVVNNSISGNWASINDASGGITYLAEYSNWFRDRLNNGSYEWPTNGTSINVNGFTRDESGTPGRVYNINPRDTLDLETLSNPPAISDVSRNPGVPTPTDNVAVEATIVDNGSVTAANLNYSVNDGPWTQLQMTTSDTVYSATIPASGDGDVVRYFLSAVDDAGDGSTLPGDTSRVTGSVFSYTVREFGLQIADVQNTLGYPVDASPYVGIEVTLQGIVMNDSTDFFGDYYIQDAAAPWSGIWVDNDANAYAAGDEVTVTGTVQENFNVTRLGNISTSSLVNAGVGEYAPVVVTTGQLATGAADAESYEGVLIRVEDPTVTDPFPDAPSNFGEFAINDGTGEVRVDDLAGAFRGNLDSLYTQGMQLDFLQGFHYFSFGNYKIIPRDSTDAPVGTISIGDDGFVPSAFELEQNWPNPFNPATDIRYSINKSGTYRLAVFNVLGQQVAILSDGQHSAGTFQVRWNGRDEIGRSVGSGIYFYRLSGEGLSLTRKMIMLK